MDDIREFGLTVMGCDGSVWPIHGPESWGRSVRLMEGDMGEFYEPPIKTVHKARVGQPGSSYVGSKTMERHVVLNVDFSARIGRMTNHGSCARSPRIRTRSWLSQLPCPASGS